MNVIEHNKPKFIWYLQKLCCPWKNRQISNDLLCSLHYSKHNLVHIYTKKTALGPTEYTNVDMRNYFQ
jgi:hypothetical protein